MTSKAPRVIFMAPRMTFWNMVGDRDMINWLEIMMKTFDLVTVAENERQSEPYIICHVRYISIHFWYIWYTLIKHLDTRIQFPAQLFRKNYSVFLTACGQSDQWRKPKRNASHLFSHLLVTTWMVCPLAPLTNELFVTAADVRTTQPWQISTNCRVQT